MSLIKKMFYLMPFSRAIAKRIPYNLEAAFFDLAEKKQKASMEDRDLLGAEIRRAAHVLEKDLYAFQEPKMKHFAVRLQELLDTWDAQNFGREETIEWAKGVLKKHKERFK